MADLVSRGVEPLIGEVGDRAGQLLGGVGPLAVGPLTRGPLAASGSTARVWSRTVVRRIRGDRVPVCAPSLWDARHSYGAAAREHTGTHRRCTRWPSWF